MRTDAPLLRVRDLSITHVGAAHPSPETVSFDIAPGEVVLVLGPSGSGKSTLSLALNGLLPQAVVADVDGTVEVRGQDAATTPVAQLSRNVAMVFQDPDAQLVTGTVLDEVAFALENLRLPVEAVLARSEDALRRVGLWERRAWNPDRLSGGGRQRLAIACAIAMGSPVIVLDEPTANLDPTGIDDVYAALADLVAGGDRALVLIEHNLDAAMHLATRALVLDRAGRLAFDGPAHEVLRAHTDELIDMGVWLPAAALAARELQREGRLPDGIPLPLTADELAGALAGCAAAAPARAAAPGRENGRNATAGAAEIATWTEGESPAGSFGGAPGGGPGGARASAPSSFRLGRENGRNAAPGTAEIATWTEGGRAEGGRTEGGRVDGERTEEGRTDVALRARDLRVRRGDTEILRGIGLDIVAGSFTAIVGANGAGKTTLIQALAGVVPPPRGSIDIDGLDPGHAAPRALAERIGFVFQNPEHQFIAHTVFDELAHGLRLRRVPDAEIAVRVDEMLHRFGLADKADVHPFLLSGGEKRRLSVGTALISRPRILALDEPTFGQDRARADELLRLLAGLQADGTTIIIVTHDLQLVAEHSTHTVVLRDGRVHAAGETAALFAEPELFATAGLRLPPVHRVLHAEAGVSAASGMPAPTASGMPALTASGHRTGDVTASEPAPSATAPPSGHRNGGPTTSEPAVSVTAAGGIDATGDTDTATTTTGDPYATAAPASARAFLHHLNPLAKIAAVIPAMLLLVFVRDLATPAAMLALGYLTILLGARLTRRTALLLFLAVPLGIVLIGAGFSVWVDAGGVDHTPPLLTIGAWTLHTGAVAIGLSTGLRLAAILALALIGGLTTSGPDLVRSSIQQLRVPYRIGYTALAAYRFVPRFGYELSVIRAAHRVRGHHGGRGPLARLARGWGYIVPLLAGAIRHAERVALAMDARAFGAHPTRTERYVIPFRTRDIVFIAAFLAASAAVFVAFFPWQL